MCQTLSYRLSVLTDLFSIIVRKGLLLSPFIEGETETDQLNCLRFIACRRQSWDLIAGRQST